VKPAFVVHLAGGREPDRDQLFESNVLTTLNVMEASAQLRSLPAVITAGSAAEYGEPRGGVASETTVCNPVTDYGHAKLAATMEARAVADRSGIRLCVIRPFNVVSPMLPVVSALGNIRYQLLAQTGGNRVIRCGRLDIVRDFIPVGFVAETVSRLLDLDTWPATLNVCSGIGTLLGNILDAAAALLEVETYVECIPELAALPAATTIVGDATHINGIGLRCDPTPKSLARLLLEDTLPS
jgi:nucleoside-diphosphate-sugar epimerase